MTLKFAALALLNTLAVHRFPPEDIILYKNFFSTKEVLIQASTNLCKEHLINNDNIMALIHLSRENLHEEAITCKEESFQSYRTACVETLARMSKLKTEIVSWKEKYADFFATKQGLLQSLNHLIPEISACHQQLLMHYEQLPKSLRHSPQLSRAHFGQRKSPPQTRRSPLIRQITENKNSFALLNLEKETTV